MKNTEADLPGILAEHQAWLSGEKGGKRANLGRANLGRANLGRANLWDADLRGAELRGANLRGANLGRANLRGANLWDANLWDANLWDANLRDADLRGANLRGADLRDANLRGANLRGANLRGADLLDVDLRDADLLDVDLRDANLRGAIGNMSEVKSAQFDVWPLAWTRSPGGVDYLQIGCQRHSVEVWEAGSDDWISNMHPRALDWWQTHREMVMGLVRASPALPWGARDDAAGDTA